MSTWEDWQAERFAGLPPAMQAAKALHELAAQMAKNSASIMNLAIRFAGDADMGKNSSAAHTYISEGCIAAEEVAAILRRFERQQPQEWLDKRRRQRAAQERTKARSAMEYSRELAPSAEWTIKTVLEFARKRRDVIGLAIACIEQERDRDHGAIVLKETAKYLSGECSIDSVARSLEQLGYTTANNVVPLVPLSRRGAS